MKIGIVCYPTYGGSGVVATELGKVLLQKGHEVHFISYQQPVRLTRFSQMVYFHEVLVSEYPLFEYPPFELALTGKMIEVAKDYHLDLLHVHYAIPHASAALMAKNILAQEGISLPYITTLHGTDITIVGRDPEFEPVITYSINQSDGVTAVSEYLRNETYKHFRVKSHIEVIPNFICLQEVEATQPDNELKNKIAPDGEPIITHISNFRKVKRIEDIIFIFQKIRDRMPAKLLMIGDGPERQKAMQLVKNLSLINDVHFIGKIRETYPLLKISRLFLLTSEYESFGLSALEAMACGVPVIASNSGGIPEVVMNNETGFLHHVGDIEHMASSAIKLLQEKDLWEKFHLNSINHSRKFDSFEIVKLYEAMYEKVLSRV